MSYQTNSLGSEEMEVGTWKPTLYNTAHVCVDSKGLDKHLENESTESY